jgi:hypothetical protein
VHTELLTLATKVDWLACQIATIITADMTRSPDLTDGLPAPDAKVLTDIQKEGFHIVGVFPREQEEGPNWAFSIGLFYSYGHPEVIIMGLPLKTCMSVVSHIGKQVKAGMHYAVEETYDDILEDPYKCAFKQVVPSQYRDHVGCALWFYDPDRFPLLQCFWADEECRFPWNDGCKAQVKSSQPLLFVPKGIAQS